MAHGTNIISQIKLPNGTQYEIHDAQAIHSVEDLGLSAALVFKGTKDTDAEITSLTSAKVGDVWLSKATSVEYVCITAVNGTANAAAWEKLGNIHNAASSTHTHNVTVTGTNETSTVTGKVTVPTVSTTTKYIGASASVPSVTPTTDSVLGANTTFTVSGGEETKTYVKATASGTAVAANGTAAAITGFGAHTTAAAITALNSTTIKNPTVTAGKAASWNATVTDGVLEISWSTNTPTAVSTSNVSVATPTAKSTADAITALGTPTTANALTGVKITAQPTITLATDTASGTGKVQVVTDVSSVSVSASGDNVDVLTGVTVGAPAVSLSAADNSAAGKVGVVSTATIGSTTANITDGVAAAQKWTQTTGTTGTPKN